MRIRKKPSLFGLFHSKHSYKFASSRFDPILFGIIVILSLFGLLMIFDASSVIAFNTFGDKYHYIKDQLIWTFLGFLFLFFFYLFDYQKLYNMALPLLIVTLIFLIGVFLPGIGSGAKGASRWLDFQVFRFQPAEFVKLALAIYLSAWFSHKEKGRFFAFALLLGAVMLLVLVQPDFGTASIILFEAVVLYFLSGGSLKHFLIALPVIVGIASIYIMSASYRMARVTNFLNLNKSLENTSYHVKQILIALGSGSLLGLGIGNSFQKYAYLPENVTDSIFPIIAEEFGFVGSVVLISLFILLLWRGFFIAMKARDNFGKLLAGGIIAFIGIQAVVNLGSMVALFPLTGVPLPFISFGGSALIVDMASIGILLNIAKQSHHS